MAEEQKKRKRRKPNYKVDGRIMEMNCYSVRCNIGMSGSNNFRRLRKFARWHKNTLMPRYFFVVTDDYICVCYKSEHIANRFYAMVKRSAYGEDFNPQPPVYQRLKGFRFMPNDENGEIYGQAQIGYRQTQRMLRAESQIRRGAYVYPTLCQGSYVAKGKSATAEWHKRKHASVS